MVVNKLPLLLYKYVLYVEGKYEEINNEILVFPPFLWRPIPSRIGVIICIIYLISLLLICIAEQL
jgi:hypothetical protein